MRQNQYIDLPCSRRTTSGAQITSPFATGFNAGSLLLEEGCPSLLRAPGLPFFSGPRQESYILIYPKTRSSDIPPTLCEYGLASFLTRQANHPITSRSISLLDGWLLPDVLVWYTRHPGPAPRGLVGIVWKGHGPNQRISCRYFLSQQHVRRDWWLVMRTTWGCTMMTWTNMLCEYLIHALYLIF